MAPKKCVVDGSSGVLDIAREIKERVKNLAYAYRLSNNSDYAERVWTELVVCIIVLSDSLECYILM